MTTTRLQCQIKAPRAQVYRALIDPQAIATWMVPDGMRGHVHTFEAWEGGNFRISLTYVDPTATGKSSEQTDTYHGQFVRLVPDEQVVEVMEFETTDPTMQGEMMVTFTLTDVDEGTVLLAVHDQVPPGIAPADNELGWQMSLGKLTALVEGN